MIVPDLMHPFFAAIAKFMSRNLRDKGYSLVISSSEEDPQLELEEIETLLARRVDALVLASSQSSKSSEVFRRLAEVGVPYVLLDRPINGLRAPFIGSDNEAIGKLSTEHLIKRGYQRIAYIGVPGLETGSGRLKGYKSVLKHYRHPFRQELVELVDSADEHGEECGYDAMQRFLKHPVPPDAVFCFNDIIASGALKAVLDSGGSIPDDVAIIGVSNLPGLSFWNSFQTPISSIDQNVPGIADRAAEMVLQLLSPGAKIPTKRTLLPLKLIVRGST
jgi:LacI family transcriptional regulator